MGPSSHGTRWSPGWWWQWLSPLARWLLALGTLCLAELIPVSVLLAGRNKLSPTLDAPDPPSQQPFTP